MEYSQTQKESIITKICDHIEYSSQDIYDFENDDVNYGPIRDIYQLYVDSEMIDQAVELTSCDDVIDENNIIYIFGEEGVKMIKNAILEVVEEQKSYIY